MAYGGQVFRGSRILFRMTICQRHHDADDGRCPFCRDEAHDKQLWLRDAMVQLCVAWVPSMCDPETIERIADHALRVAQVLWEKTDGPA